MSWAVDRKQLVVDECYADTEYEVYAAECAVRGRYLVSDLGTAPKNA